MKYRLLTGLISCTLFCVKAGATNKHNTTESVLVENAGQVLGLDNKLRTDIDFKVSSFGTEVFISDASLHYQWRGKSKGDSICGYRMDMLLLGANENARLIKQNPSRYYEVYNISHVPHGLVAHSYEQATYKDIYPGIDWVIYSKDGYLEYDFVVHEGADPSIIKLKYEGAGSQKIVEGNFIAKTILGEIKEQKPYSYVAESKLAVPSSFVLNNGVLSFDVAKPQAGQTIVIDPKLVWGSYVGGFVETYASAVARDANGNTYLSGHTTNAYMASFTTHQFMFGGGVYDCFISRLNDNGAKMWTAFFGGEGNDMTTASVCDTAGSIYIAGTTTSETGIANAQSGNYIHQPKKGGGYEPFNVLDGFIAKFDNTGNIYWSTYYGGTRYDAINSMACDAKCNVIIGGYTRSKDSNSYVVPTVNNLLSSIGAFLKDSSDGFFAKFNSVGQRQWASYFRGIVNGVACDTAGNVYIGGKTIYYSNIATSGAHQSLHAAGGGVTDGYIAKFNANGIRQWGTYYGGTGEDEVMSLGCDIYDNIYAGGTTSSTNGTSIATAGAFQTAASTSFIIRLSQQTSQRKWGSYYPDLMTEIACDSSGKIWFGGYKAMPQPPPPSWIFDFETAKFNLKGQRLANFKIDGGFGQFDPGFTYGAGKISISGSTSTNNTLGTPGAMQQFGLDPGLSPQPPPPFPYQGFIQTYTADTAVYIKHRFKDTILCAGDTKTLEYKVINDFRPGNVFKVQLSNAAGSFSSPIDIGSATASGNGTLTYTVPSTGITYNVKGYRIRIVASSPADTTIPEQEGYDIRISSYPSPIAAVPYLPVCAGSILTVQDNGNSPLGTSYTWNGPNGFTAGIASAAKNNVQFADSGWYRLTADNFGCVVKDSVHVEILPNPDPITVQSNSPVCTGDTLKVWATTATTGVTWVWLKPAGYFPDAQGDTTIPVAAHTDSGSYKAQAVLNGCPSNMDSTRVHIIQSVAPTVTLSANPGPKATPTTEILFSSTNTFGGTSPSYQWTRNLVYLPGANQSTYTAKMSLALQDSDIICIEMNSNEICAKPTLATNCITVEEDLAVDDLSNAKDIHLYPNPNTGTFVLKGKVSTAKDVSVEIANIAGQVVYKTIAAVNNGIIDQPINLNGRVAGGIYVLRISDGARSSQLRFAIK